MGRVCPGWRDIWALMPVLALWALLGGATTALAEPTAKALPTPMDRGTVARVVIEGLEGPAAPEGVFDKRPVFFFAAGGKWYGLFGADILISPGRYPLALTWPGGGQTIEIRVRDRSYGVRSITVPENQVKLSRADQARAERERKEVAAALATKSPERLWRGPWIDPSGGAVSSGFGRQTRINGVLSARPHLGADFDVPTGTPVKAPADGTVILTGDHFFAGRSVYVDHGQGLISMYFHLSKIEVKAGDRIKQGQMLARSGASGRVDGAHLHYGIYLNQARIDPVAFQRLTTVLPKN